jgi:uncharacterized membrane protein
MLLNEFLDVVIVSSLPISELRGGIPLALYYGMSPVTAYFICVLSNAMPIPFLLLFLEKIGIILNKWRVTSKIYGYFVRRTEKRRDIIDRYGYLGLTFFVAIPLPITGAWTGSLLSFLLGMNKKKSFLHIFAGILIAGLLVISASLGVLLFIR